MDVARYIGLFLLKNNFVYIHGLGNLELRKKPSSYNGAALQGPSFEVILTPLGSIDDNLANFIATNEQISISKAANALKEFSTQTRIEIQNGKTVLVSSIGMFKEEKGKTIFITDPHFQYTPPNIPTTRVSRHEEEKTYTTNADIPAVKPRYIDPDEAVEERAISWTKVGVWIVTLVVLSAGVYFAAQYLNRQDNIDEAPLIQTPVEDTLQQPTVAITDTADIVQEAQNGLLSFDVVLHTYTELWRAERREQQLKSYGHNVSILKNGNDTSLMYLILQVRDISPADTAKLLDSLTRYINPKHGVRVLKQ